MIEFFRFNEDGNKHAQRLMRRAIELDPKFGPPYARLAYAAPLSMIYFDAEPTVEAFDESVAYARKAVGLSCAKDAWPHIALGKVHLLQCDYESALAESQIAVQLNPNLGVAHCGVADALTYMGLVDDATAQFETAIRISPQDPWRWAFFAYRSLAHLFREEYDAAVDWADNALRVPNCAYWANAHMASALGASGYEGQGQRGRCRVASAQATILL